MFNKVCVSHKLKSTPDFLTQTVIAVLRTLHVCVTVCLEGWYVGGGGGRLGSRMAQGTYGLGLSVMITTALLLLLDRRTG